MAITTPESFLEVLEKSKLLTAEQLAEARDAARETDDAKGLAETLVRQELLSRWQAEELLAQRSSFYVGKYKLVDLLGRGGMGSVFFARHTTMNRPVALKIISERLGQDPASLERFFTEARAIAALNHPNIVHAYNVDNEGDRYYMVMEFVEGQDLQRMVEAEGPLDYARAADYIRQAADGLAHAHSRNMIHCDVKPANLLVSRQGVVKILDMGMARLVGRQKRERGGQEEGVLGTVDYLPPEQALESPELDHRADIYSLGCTFYFLLTGHPPFPEGTLHERILKHQTQQPRSIVEHRPDAPSDLARICRKMMAKNPANRYQTAEEVAQLLAEWQPPKWKLARAVPLDETRQPQEELPIVVDVGPQIGPSRGDPGRLTKLTADWRRVLRERPRRAMFAGIGAALGLMALVGLLGLLVLSGSGEDGDRQTPRTAARDDGSLSQSPPPAGPEEDDAEGWRTIPAPAEVFDPEAFADASAAGDQDDGQQRPKKAATDKAGQKRQGAKKAGAGGRHSGGRRPEKKKAGKPALDESSPAPAAPEKPAETPKSHKPKPKEAEDKDPFTELANVIELPKFDGSAAATSPVRLGRIHTAGDVDWRLSLHGGGEALKSPRQMVRKFVLHETGQDAAKATWVIRLEESISGSDPKTADVARIWREADSLMFQWAAGADPASANYLRNCLLQVQASGKSRYLALAKPKRIEPVAIDLVRGATTRAFTLNWPPESSRLRVAITKVEGREGHRVEPAAPAPPGLVGLYFDRVDRHGNTREGVQFRVVFGARSSSLSCKVQVLEPPPVWFRRFQNQDLAALRNTVEVQRQQIEQALNPKNPKAAPKDDQKLRLNRQLDELDKGLWYVEFYEQVRRGAKLHFRVFIEVDDRQLLLATTEPP